MTGHGAKLGRKKEQAIIALLKCRTVEEAAESIGVAPKTLYRWQKLPEFDREYREAMLAQFRLSLARLQQASAPAVTVLRNILAESQGATGREGPLRILHPRSNQEGHRDRRNRKAS